MTPPYCTKHKKYECIRPPTSDCATCRRAFKRKHLFTLAIVKALGEGFEATLHFGSLLGFAYHREEAVEAGYVTNGPSLKLTPAGEKFYETMKLKDAPDGRATFWCGSKWWDS